MAAAALRAAVRQLFQPHLNPKPSLGSTLLRSPPQFKAHVGTLETLNPGLSRLASLQTGAAAKLGGAAAPGPCSLGIARLARVMLNYFGVGVTAWAASRELTGEAWTAYASAPKRHVSDPLPTRASWPARSGPFLSSILTSSSPSKEKPNPGSPEASKNPLWESFEAKCALGSERASSPVLAAAYDSQWARARSPPTIGLTGVPSVWGSPESARPHVLGVAKQAGTVEKEAATPTKGMRVGAQPSSSPSAGLGLLMEEPVLPLMAPNIGWELVTSGLGWKGASMPSPEDEGVRAAAKETVPAGGEELLVDSTSWSLIPAGGVLSIAAEGATENEPGQCDSTRAQVGTSEGAQVAASQHLKYIEQSVQDSDGEPSNDGALSDAHLLSEFEKACSKITSTEAGQSKSSAASKALEDKPLETADGSFFHRNGPGRSETNNPCIDATPFEPLDRKQVTSVHREAQPSNATSHLIEPSPRGSSSTSLTTPAPAPILEDRKQKLQQSRSRTDGGAPEADCSDPPGEARNTGSVLQRRVSVPIEIHQGRAEGRPFATSAPANQSAQPNKTDLTSRVNEVRLLGEALCHSQTRARRAEEREAATSLENDRLKHLLFSEAMQKSTWQICLALQTADVSLLPVAIAPALPEGQPQATQKTEAEEARTIEHAEGESRNHDKEDGRTDKGIDFVDCVITIAFGVALGVVCFGNWGFGWFILRSL